MAVLYTPHFIQFFDNNGDPLSGGKLYAYSAGTTTPKDTYTTAAASVANTNPVVLDSAGRAVVFLSGSYKLRLEDALGNLIKETDNVTAFSIQSSTVDDITTNFTTATPVFADNFIFADVSDSNATRRSPMSSMVASAADIRSGTSDKLVDAAQLLTALRPYSTTTATTSGSDAQFTSINTGVRRIVLAFSGVSSNGTGLWTIEIGDSGGFETSGYAGAVTRDGGSASFSTSFVITSTTVASDTYDGVIEIYRGDSSTNTWHIRGTLSAGTGPLVHLSTGSKSLSAELDRLRVVAGGNTFDAGKITCEAFYF